MNIGILALTMPLTLAAPLEMPIPAAPMLHVKILPPEGSKTLLYTGGPTATSLPEGQSIGLRPGYSYRFEVGNLPEKIPGSVFPSIEVRGTLQMPRPADAAKHPVPIVLTEDEILKAMEGRFITKVIYLEDPEKAEAITTKPDQLLEYAATTEKDAIKESRERGRLVLILRIGERNFTPEELAIENVPGTIQLPGQPLAMPSRPPFLPYGGIPLYDPISGPKMTTEECLHDGGDQKVRLGIGLNNKLNGLDPSDTSIEFTTKGVRKVDTSNRVCICIPRFAAYKVEVAPSGYVLYNGALMNLGKLNYNGVQAKIPARNIFQSDGIKGYDSRLRSSAMQRDFAVANVNAFSGIPMAMASHKGVAITAEIRSPEDVTAYPCYKPMVLQKWCDPAVPEKIGDEVTFYLRYNNTSASPMTEVVVSDSLTARLEYVNGTAKSDRPATLTVTANEVGSVTLRWAIDGKLLPGESGQISFKAKVR